MKRSVLLVALLLTAVFSSHAQFQFRAAGNLLNPVEASPVDSDALLIAVNAPSEVLSGWHWEVLLNRFGFGMHYALDLYQESSTHAMVDWKGDFFFSYHPFGAGSLIDPFFELGWGNAGSAQISDASDGEYPDWERAARSDDTTALTLYSYAATGLALDLKGLLVGARAAWMPHTLQEGVPGSGIPLFDLDEFELALFAGIALGAH